MTLEFFEHPVSELSHNDLLVTLTLSPTSDDLQMQHLARQRLSSNAFIGIYSQKSFSHVGTVETIAVCSYRTNTPDSLKKLGN